ncbi:MAG: co-chaperone GroES [Candidatus Pacebacteria bacterium]|nr:co-chaperone GroES [Candidatus Paceibacterota bacterium]
MPKAKKTKNVSAKTSSRAAEPLTPLNDRVIVRPLSPEEMGTTTASGIIIPDSSKEKPEQGTVIAVGPGKWNEDGDARLPMGVSVGDRVMFSKYGFDEIKIKGVTYYVLAESNILAVLN